MVEPFADFSDLTGRWAGKVFSDEGRTEAENLLGDASGIVRSEVPGVDARIAAGRLDPATVRAVVVAMVKRHINNRDGLLQFADAIDDRTESGTYGTAAAEVEMYLTDREAKRLGAGRGRAFTISPSVPAAYR